MAKKQVFGEEVQQLKAAHKRMAKVIIATKNSKGKFGYKEAIVEQDVAQEFIKKHSS